MARSEELSGGTLKKTLLALSLTCLAPPALAGPLDGPIFESFSTVAGSLAGIQHRPYALNLSLQTVFTSTNVVRITMANQHRIFKAADASDKPLYIYYSAPGCRSCHVLAPFFESFADQNASKAMFGSVDVGVDPPLARENFIPHIYKYQGGEFVQMAMELQLDSAGNIVGASLVPAHKIKKGKKKSSGTNSA